MHFRHRQTDRQTDGNWHRSISARCIPILHLALKTFPARRDMLYSLNSTECQYQCQCQCQSKIFSVAKIAELLRSPQRRSRVTVQNQETIVTFWTPFMLHVLTDGLLTTTTVHEVQRACVFPCRSCQLERTAWQHPHRGWSYQISTNVEISLALLLISVDYFLRVLPHILDFSSSSSSSSSSTSFRATQVQKNFRVAECTYVLVFVIGAL